ncbi:hypothetical protein [Chitinilyticum litopenaei]|uniref:hypothetical protein n=1 Tax=Chitinilyticum litopenaei TaxID=1121276 RepID=UPI000403EE0D|nr:hypothetical protein [Chitinilyticum litopenaei]
MLTRFDYLMLLSTGLALLALLFTQAGGSRSQASSGASVPASAPHYLPPAPCVRLAYLPGFSACSTELAQERVSCRLDATSGHLKSGGCWSAQA